MAPSRMYASILAVLLLASVAASPAQEEKIHRGRKYKALPPTSHIQVEVLRNDNGKPLANAAVIFHSIHNGKDEGNLEVKTNEEGKAVIDVIPTESDVEVQVIAEGFATFAETYPVRQPTREILVKMLSPRAQISTYTETHGEASQRPVGVQEPERFSKPPVTQAPKPANRTSAPNSIAPASLGDSPATNPNPTPR